MSPSFPRALSPKPPKIKLIAPPVLKPVTKNLTLPLAIKPKVDNTKLAGGKSTQSIKAKSIAARSVTKSSVTTPMKNTNTLLTRVRKLVQSVADSDITPSKALESFMCDSDYSLDPKNDNSNNKDLPAFIQKQAQDAPESGNPMNPKNDNPNQDSLPWHIKMSSQSFVNGPGMKLPDLPYLRKKVDQEDKREESIKTESYHDVLTDTGFKPDSRSGSVSVYRHPSKGHVSFDRNNDSWEYYTKAPKVPSHLITGRPPAGKRTTGVGHVSLNNHLNARTSR